MKKYKVLQTESVKQDIVNTAFYIKTYLKNVDAAKRFVANMDKEIGKLEMFPYRYQAVYGDIRIKTFESYIIAFIINENNDEILVLRVLKEEQDLEWVLKRM